MKATIELRNLRIYAYHGCFEEEQVVGNNFIVDADLLIDASLPAQTDSVSDSLNYVGACETIRDVMSRPRHLLETVVADLVSELHARHDAQGLLGGWVRVRKMAPPIGVPMESVGVKMDL